MRERGILFSDEMVRAIIDGRKTQTRRVVKLPPWLVRNGGDLDRATMNEGGDGNIFAPSGVQYLKVPCAADGTVQRLYCPHADAPGDRLWVREAWRVASWDEDGRVWIDYRAADSPTNPGRNFGGDDFDVFVDDEGRRLEACGAKLMQWNDDGRAVPANGDEDECFWALPEGVRPPWRPSIFMPRWASRITLEITEVRVQRLHDITPEDAIAEGIDMSDAWTASDPWRAYIHLWNSINGADASLANPWCWAITFKRVEASSRAA